MKKTTKKNTKKRYPKTMTIRVTKADIENAVPLSAVCCPIARAIHRQGWNRASVAAHQMFLDRFDREPSCYNLPDKARAFVNRFDRKYPVKPFQFTVKH